MSSALICLSGGLDSTANLVLAKKQYQVDHCLFFKYGQIPMAQEQRAVESICKHYDCQLHIVELPFFSQFDSALLKGGIPLNEEVKIDCAASSEKSASAVWVPNRNGIFLNVAAAFAEHLNIQWVITGFNVEEAKTFPDNSREYLQSLNESFSYSTRKKVQITSLTVDMDKSEIVNAVDKEGFPFELIWSCYQNQTEWCGQCESCMRLKRALGEDRFIRVRGEHGKRMA